jgi:hypothetical protein
VHAVLPLSTHLSFMGLAYRWQMRKPQSSMQSPWEQDWAREVAQGRAPGTGRAQGRPHPLAAEGPAEGPLLQAMALTRTSKPGWTTSESPELEIKPSLQCGTGIESKMLGRLVLCGACSGDSSYSWCVQTPAAVILLWDSQSRDSV